MQAVNETSNHDWQRRVNAALKEGIDMDEQAEIKKVEEVTEYTETHPVQIDPATGLPVANPITLPAVEAANAADMLGKLKDENGQEVELPAGDATYDMAQLATADDEEVAK